MLYIDKVLPAITAATIACSLELSATHSRIPGITWISALLTVSWQILALSPYQD